MICEKCKKDIKMIDYTGFPIYYFGAGPDNPQDAEMYFCGPKCSNEWYKENKDWYFSN